MSILPILISTVTNALERGKSPIMGSFITSWIAFNWKIILVLLYANIDIIEKINLIETKYISTYNSFIYPAIFTSFYLVIHPIIYRFTSDLKYNMISKATEFKIDSEIRFMDKKKRLTRLEIDNQYEKELNEIKRFHDNANREFDLKKRMEETEIDLEFYRKKKELEFKRKEFELDQEIKNSENV
jgi:hypothetical protein